MLHPAELTPQRLASELARSLSDPPPSRRAEISFGGLDELARAVGSSIRPFETAPVLAGGQL
jgi:predicted glycosyltransferase